MTFPDLKEQMGLGPKLNMRRIEKAYLLANKVHKGQKRRSGDPFIVHPLEVASIIHRIGGSENMICAALLHDVIEDTRGEEKENMCDKIYNEFGIDIFFLVQALSKDIRIENNGDRQEEYIDRMEEAFHIDSSIFLLKMADLLHNIATLSELPKERQRKWIHELKTKYMPLLQNNFHKISFHYHDMYLHLINEIESVIEKYEKKLSLKK